MNRLPYLLLVLAAFIFVPDPAKSHALQPGYLSVEPIAPDTYRVFFRKPDVQGRPMQIDVLLPELCAPRQGSETRSDGFAWISTWIATCVGGLSGGKITIEGLEKTSTDVLARFETQAGQSGSKRLTPKQTSFLVPRDSGMFEVFQTYLVLGVDHILSGWDHLLFVLLLVILVPDKWRLVGAVTAFTVAHSITLSAAALEWIVLSPQPVEVVIALSIMFLASEILQRQSGERRLSEQVPWLVTFAFGLLHGFGFAGALREIGLPQHETPMALFSFNLGVEIGQLAFVFGVLLIRFLLSRLGLVMFHRAAQIATVLGVYAAGTISAFWFIERLSAT